MRGSEYDCSRRGARGGRSISGETTQRLIELSSRADHFVSEHRAGLLSLSPIRALLPNSSLVDVGLHEKVGSLAERDGSQCGARGVPGRGEIHTLDGVEGQIHPKAVAFGIDVPGQDLTSLGGVRNQVVRASPSCNAMPGANRKVRALNDRNWLPCVDHRLQVRVGCHPEFRRRKGGSNGPSSSSSALFTGLHHFCLCASILKPNLSLPFLHSKKLANLLSLRSSRTPIHREDPLEVSELLWGDTRAFALRATPASSG